MKRLLIAQTLILLLPTLAETPAFSQEPKLVLLESEDPVGRLNYPVLISNGRGYRIRCAEQADEEAVIRGLGFLTAPSTVLTPLDPEIAAAKVLENPLLCPTAADYEIKVFAHNAPQGLTHYLQFPDGFGSSSFTDRIYTLGCAGLAEALKLDLGTALAADPTPFFSGKIHDIACLTGDPVQPHPQSFADWCLKGDRTAAETATVMALLAATPGGVAALGDPAGCAAADTFLGSVTAINLSGSQISDLGPLSVLTHLNSLTLADNEITDVAPLSDLRAAIFLDLAGNRIVNLAALATLTALTDLKLADNEISDLRPLATLAALTSLDLGANKVSDVGPLAFNQALTSLNLASNLLTGGALEPLTGLGALQSLDLSDNQIESLELLGQFPSTTEIRLAGNPVLGTEALTFLDSCILRREDATPYGFTLRAMIEVSGEDTCEAAAAALNASPVLDLAGKSISDLRPIALVENLTSLNLSGNSIVDVGPLQTLAGLSSLDLSSNNITDIRPIAPLVNLTTFNAAGNPVAVDDYLSACLMGEHEDVLTEDQQREMEALFDFAARDTCFASEDRLKRFGSIAIQGAGLKTVDYFRVAQNVRNIDLSDNQLTDVSALADLPQLGDLRLAKNQLSSLTSLRRFDKLEILVLDRNPISQISDIQNLRGLRQVFLNSTSVTFIRPLGTLPRLTRAGLAGLHITYENLEDYCLVHKLDTMVLGSVRAFMTALEDLAAAANVDMSDCRAVQQWGQGLQTLNLNKKNLTSIAPVRMFGNLRELHLFDNRITTATPLVALLKLKTLNLAKNRLQSFPVLFSSVLEGLYLQQNQLASATPFGSKTSLKNLRLDQNRIQDARPLQSLSNVKYLDLRSNRLRSVATVQSILSRKPYLKGNPVCPASAVVGVWPAGLLDACRREPPLIAVWDRFRVRDDMVIHRDDLIRRVPPGRLTPIQPPPQ